MSDVTTPTTAGLNVSATAGTSAAVVKKPMEMSRECFDYMIKHDVPGLVDGVCKLLFQTQPDDPAASVAQYFTAQRFGAFHGGLALAGSASSGGWLRVFTSHGTLGCSVDRIPIQLAPEHTELQLMCGGAKENCVFIVSSPSGADAGDGPAATGAPNSCIRKYDAATGQLVGVFDLGKTVSCILSHRERNHIWAFFKSGGCSVLQASNGVQIREIGNTPPTQAAVIRHSSLLLLTLKAIERRDLDTLQLEHVIHLPDSMMKPTAFVANSKHLWCASANPDGSANFIGIYDATGRPVSTFLPPPVSLVAVDPHRGGTWHLPKQSASSGQLTFVNERGTKILTCDLGRFKKGGVAVDRGSGLLWVFRSDEEQRCRIGLYHPYQQQYVVDFVTPDAMGTSTTFMTAL